MMFISTIIRYCSFVITTFSVFDACYSFYHTCISLIFDCKGIDKIESRKVLVLE